MIDDIVEIAVAASADIAIDKAAKRHRWVRIKACLLCPTLGNSCRNLGRSILSRVISHFDAES